ncbi:MAG: agglutinin biogenesis protein MshP [Nitrosomonadales bacterium]|nr:agglutinin biogenesis protein MshP [Nitrosomonadales bacterium]
MRKIQRGFSLISAIFLLVVIAALGTFAVTLSTTQQQSAALDVLGARAYQASRVGIEWGAYQVLPASAAAFASTCRTAGSHSQILSGLPNSLAGFTVTVQCNASSHVEATSTLWVYNLTSTAAQGVVANPDYVERQMAVTIAQ